MSLDRNLDFKRYIIGPNKFDKCYTGHKNKVTSLAVSSDNKFFISGYTDSSIRLWDLIIKKVLK
jgi:WD40 repeat protein